MVICAAAFTEDDFIQVTRLEDAAVQQLAMQSQGLKMPCILKPLLACGPKWSHDLAIVFDIKALLKAEVNSCPYNHCHRSAQHLRGVSCRKRRC